MLHLVGHIPHSHKLVCIFGNFYVSGMLDKEVNECFHSLIKVQFLLSENNIIHGMHPVYVWCEDQAIDLKEVDADVNVVVAAVKNCL